MSNALNTKLLVGYIQFVDLETGFWQIVEDEAKFRISNIAEELKKENLRIAAIVEMMDNEMSIFMTGKSIKIIEYKIIK